MSALSTRSITIASVGMALMQHDATPLDPGVVEEVFASIDGFVGTEGAAHARRSRGVLVSGLSGDKAKAMQQRLLDKGIVVERAEDRWLSVPRSISCRRAAVESGGLRVFDLYGRDTLIPFERILAVVGGIVTRGEVQRTKDARAVRHGRSGVEVEDAEYGVVERDELIVDVVTGTPTRRYRIEASRFDYAYLGDRKRSSSADNLALLVGDVMAARPAIATGRGAERLLAGERKHERYRSSRDFDLELAWLLWRHHGPGAALDGVIDHRKEPFGHEPPTAAERFDDNVKIAAVERIRRDLASDRERYLARTKTFDMVLATLAGVIAVAYVMIDMGISLGEDGILFVALAAFVFAIVGAVSFVGLRQWREKRFWVDGPS